MPEAANILHGDCLELLDGVAPGSVDMVLCDLPYGTTRNGWDSVIDLDALWTHYDRVVKPNGAIVLFGQGMFSARLMTSRPDRFRYRIVWVKSKPTNFLNARRQPLRRHEDVCVFYAKQPTYHPQMSPGAPYDKGVRKDQLTGSYGDFAPVRVKSDGGRFPTDVVYFATAEGEPGDVLHPTQKPVALARWLVRTFTDPGDLVLDNACGSGSLLVGAALEGRRTLGIELGADHVLFRGEQLDMVDVARRRVGEALASFASTAGDTAPAPATELATPAAP